MNTRILPGAGGAAAWFPLAAMVSAASNRPCSPVSLERLGPVPTEDTAVTFSPDGSHVSWVSQQSNRWVVRVDGRTGTRYDHILEISPAAERLYVNGMGREPVHGVVDGGPDSSHAAAVASSLRFTNDGSHFDYFAQPTSSSGNVELILKGRRIATFDQVLLEEPDTVRFKPVGSLLFLAIKNNAYVRDSCATESGGTITAQPASEVSPVGDVKPTPPIASATPPSPRSRCRWPDQRNRAQG